MKPAEESESVIRKGYVIVDHDLNYMPQAPAGMARYAEWGPFSRARIFNKLGHARSSMTQMYLNRPMKIIEVDILLGEAVDV